MLISSFKKLFFVSFVLVTLVFVSCQKEVDINDPGLIPEEVKDSTLLIKSIAWVYNNGKDSIVEKYSYDTVNKKITLNWTDTYSDPVFPGDQSEYHNTKAELSYNSRGLLVHVVYTYPPSYTPSEYDYNTIDITYDSDNIVQKIVIKYMGGNTSSNVFTKTMLQGGNYRLEWSIVDPDISQDTYFRTAIFSSDGKNILNTIDHRYIDTSPSGDPVEYKFIKTDSLVYDAAGNTVKILTNSVDGRDNTIENYTSYEYNGRQTKGDQLYNQRRLLMNGIANISFGEIDDVSYGIGILSFHFEYEYLQYSKCPIETAKVRMWDGSIKNFTTNPTYDSKDRLTKFTGFFHDLDLEPLEYRITYYK